MRPHDETGKILELIDFCAKVAEAGYDGFGY